MIHKRVFVHVVYLSLLIPLYILPYYVMSRSGAAQARAWGMKGYFFVLPVNEEAARTNSYLEDFYLPLIEIENALGTNIPPVRGGMTLGLKNTPRDAEPDEGNEHPPHGSSHEKGPTANRGPVDP
jgi:hypothetical protein